MNDDELKQIWQQQPLRTPDASPQQLVAAMQKHASQFRHIIEARDIRELVACAVVVVIFGIFFFNHGSQVSRLGDLIVIGSAIFIAWKLIATRREHRPAPPGATTIESLRVELESVRAQSRLLGSVLWWYLLPGFIGLVISTWGGLPVNDPGAMRVMIPTYIVMTLVFIAVDWFVYRLNQRAVATQLRPLEEQLEAMLRSAETGEPVAEKHAAKLRPIVLSMKASDKIKPVEFSVAFWQLAIFGVPGIVGFWFFWIPGPTFDDNAGKTNEPRPPAMVQAVFTGETNRYSAVAMKVVERFNAGDYAAVQKLYNSNMAKTFPPEKTATFYGWLATEFGRVEKFNGPTGKGYFGQSEFQLHFEHGELPMSLALDADDDISGIYFKTPSSASAKFKLAVRHFFSWRHLAWLPFFVLGGLLYSWLMQNTVKRAVGISALGIHLRKGHTLILWGEITEVRLFKLLHIRNLELVKESGEQTRMHWTPLERHSEVAAAVEKFAPVNHPIRKYLSLLRRTPPK